MGRLIAVTSGKGGVGKSSVAIGLASTVAADGKTVLLIDLDAGMRCLDLMLGVSDRLVFDLADVLSGSKNLSDALLYPSDRKGMALLAAPSEDKWLPGLRELLLSVTDHFDYTILDFPAGVCDGLYDCLPRFAELLVVCNPDPVSIRDAGKVGISLSRWEFLSVRLIINRFRPENIKNRRMSNIDDMIDACGIRLLAIIPEDESVYHSAVTGRPLQKGGRAAMAFKRLAKRMEGYSLPLPSVYQI